LLQLPEKIEVGNMRDATNIQLDQLIIHILDPKRPDSPVLSECTIPLEGDQRIVDYFVTHIQNSLKNPTAKAARFVVIDDEIVSGVCKALLEDRLDLVEGSRRLAQGLYEIIAEDRRINACDLGSCNSFIRAIRDPFCRFYHEFHEWTNDTNFNRLFFGKHLAVCLYRAENQHSVSRYLALLSIEPSEVFRHKKEHDPQGNLYVNYEIETEIMPTTREKLQKCAFIQGLEPRPDYDMMMLDRQKREGVAKFFIGFGTKMPTDNGWFLRQIFQKTPLHIESKNNIVPKPSSSKTLWVQSRLLMHDSEPIISTKV
jgi:hypothetical protein